MVEFLQLVQCLEDYNNNVKNLFSVIYIYIQLQTALGATVNNNTIQKLKQKYKRTKMTAKTGSKYIKKVTKNNIYYNKTGKFSVKAPFSIYKTTLKQLNKTAEPKADQVSYISF